MRDVPDPRLAADQVAVKVVRLGLCMTDAEINHGTYGEAPRGSDFLILGHENFGIVEEVGKKVKGFRAGDRVVSTVRRPCGVCDNCRHGENDMCSSGRYTERGIMRRHGFMAEYYVESPRWLFKIPNAIEDVGVLLEPMSVVEKAIDHAFRVQRRLRWKPRTAFVLGAGPVGLLAATVLRVRGLDTHVAGREPATDRRAALARKIGATYHSVADQSLFDVQRELPPIDLAVEATGAASVVFQAMQMLGRNGVLCLLSVTAGSGTATLPVEQINHQLVLNSNVVFGSVNANLTHFSSGIRDLVSTQKKYPGVLAQLITERLGWDQYRRWFDGRASGIKTVLELPS
jgi:glucose 1-dehydrogenase